MLIQHCFFSYFQHHLGIYDEEFHIFLMLVGYGYLTTSFYKKIKFNTIGVYTMAKDKHLLGLVRYCLL